ncbi:MAG: VWA domain-containing protein [Rhodospirillales bacterium]
MVNRLRVARLDASQYQSLGPGSPPDAALHRRLDATIRRHLPAVTASLFAQPAPTADGRIIEWYSDLSGQPVPLAALSAGERSAAETVLADRLRSLTALADRLASGEDAELGQALRQALSYPSEANVYVVDRQPVLTFWGYRPLAAPPAVEPAGTDAPPTAPLPAAETVNPSTARLPRWLLPLAGLLALAAIIVGVFASGLVRWPPWGPDYVRLLQAAGEEEQALQRRIAGLTADLQGKLAYCSLDRALAAAKADEDRLAGRLAEMVTALAAARDLCPLRAALADATKTGADLDQRRQKVARDLAAAIEACRKKAREEARKEEQARRQAEAEKRQAAEAQRKAEQARRQAETAAPTPPPALSPAQPPAETPGKPNPPQATPQPPPASPPPEKSARAPDQAPCPGERTPEEAPDAAIVLDASGSMRLPADASISQIQGMLSQLGPLGALGAAILGQAGGGPTRLEAAKRGVNSVVRSMPDDVDVGLVTLERCPTATNNGFFSGAQRGQLYARVNGLTPMQGTPLAQGVLQAGEMVDGVKAPAVMVVISDGDDSCGGDPCSAARRLHAQKPLLKINVVDILGTGAGSCMANATGGRVLKPGDGLAFEKTIKDAAQDAIKPAHCR